MNYYDSFLEINKNPNLKWGERLQELSNKMFINSSTYQEDVKEENEFGTLDFYNIEARITSLVDAKTGQRVNDDFKKIIFSDFSHKPILGTRYEFSNNIWIAFSVDNIKSVTCSAYLRRCNNTLNSQDKYGRIHREPCAIDYKSTETQLSSGETIAVPSGRIYVQCQYNDYTKNIDIDDRFILGSYVYKVRYISDYDRQSTFDNNSYTLISFYADFDNKSSCDNFDLGIANYKEYNYVISCDDEITGRVGEKGNISVNISLDNKLIENEDVIFQNVDNDNVVSIDNNGEYTLLKEGIANIKIYMKNLETCYKIVTFNVNNINNNPYIVPNINIIPINQTMNYEIIFDSPLEIKIDTENPNYYYDFSVDNNKFSISNYKQSNIPIYIIYKNADNSINGKFEIYLGGIF